MEPEQSTTILLMITCWLRKAVLLRSGCVRSVVVVVIRSGPTEPLTGGGIALHHHRCMMLPSLSSGRSASYEHCWVLTGTPCSRMYIRLSSAVERTAES